MCMRRNIIILLIKCACIAMLCSTNLLEAFLVNAHTLPEFSVLIKNHPLAIGLFYDDVHAKSKALRVQMLQMVEEFRYVSESNLYSDIGFVFLLVDLSNRESRPLMRQYFEHGLPSLVIFQRGKPLENKEGKIISLCGFVQLMI